MPDRQYTRFRLVRNGAVLRVVFDHPPMNLFDQTMISECSALLDDLRADRSVRVVLFSSADPDFFLGHADLSLFLAPREGVPPKPVRLTLLQDLFERLRTVPQATIAVVEGRATGAGVELVTSCDMAFAARGRAVLTLFETAVGVLPGATGTQRLPRLMGRQRSLEFILGCQDFDTDLAERYGVVNRAFDATELWPFVENLAQRIGTFPSEAIAMNKVAVDASEHPLAVGLLEETHALDHALATGEGQRRMAALLELGAQTPEFELRKFTAALATLGGSDD